jgi:ATP-binding cassette, subfamily F, member 3
VAQEVPSSATSLLDTVLEADTERAALLAESATATDPARIADIQSRLADIDAWSAEGRASPSCAVLALTPEAQCALFGFLGRLADAGGAGGGAVCPARLLLLDEPTNYLDLEGRAVAGKLSRALSAYGHHHQP